MRKWIIGILVIALAIGVYWRLRAKPKPIGQAYVGERYAPVWTTTAEVRQTVATLHWGDQVSLLSRSGNDSRVRTIAGVEGWMDSRALLDDAAWQSEIHLLAQARSMTIQAPGRTKVVTNVRLDPGRDATRVYQLAGGVPVAILARKTEDVPATPGAATPENEESPKREDWLLISAPAAKADAAAGPQSGESVQQAQAELVTGSGAQSSSSAGASTVPPLAGWVIGRFIALDLPEAIRDYASSSDLRPVAWFVLNRVGNGGSEIPQFLVAGTRGAEGQPCDFTMLRVYTWSAAKSHYETAFVENDLCGSLPIQVGKREGSGDPEFRFTGLSEKEPREERVYVMHQTIVRRVREGEAAAPRKARHN
jgi:hypothetical protein